MNTKSTLSGTKRTALATIASALILAAPPAAVAGSRPFSDWLSAQGQDVTFWPPVKDYVGWFTNPTPAPSHRPPDTSNLFALVDLSLAGRQQPTTSSGRPGCFVPSILHVPRSGTVARERG